MATDKLQYSEVKKKQYFFCEIKRKKSLKWGKVVVKKLFYSMADKILLKFLLYLGTLELISSKPET